MEVQLVFLGAVVLLGVVSTSEDAYGALNGDEESVRDSDVLMLEGGQNAKRRMNLADGSNASNETSEKKTTEATNTTKAPTNATNAPPSTTHTPSSTTQVPTSTTQVPTSTTEASANSDDTLDFTKYIYVASIPQTALRTGYKIPLNVAFKQSYTAALKFILEDVSKLKMTSYFKIERTGEKLALSVKENIPAKTLQEVSQLLFSLRVTKKNSTTVLCHTTLIVNLNDEFKFSFSDVTVGYPKSYDFIERYAPSVVTSFAPRGNTCSSKGFNMRFLIRTKDCPFAIHEKTGNIYPIEYHGDSEDVRCAVVVQNVEGDKVRNEQNLTLTVKFLEPAQMVELFMRNVTLENLDSALTDITSETNITLKVLSYTVLPSNLKASKANLSFVRIYGYAFEKQTNDILGGDVIVEKLKLASNLYDARVLSEEESPEEPARLSYDYTLIIAVILLLIVVLILGSAVFYVVFMRNGGCILCGLPCPNSDATSTTPLEDDMEGPSHTRWINLSRIHAFDRSNHTSVVENGFAAADYHNPETVTMDWKNYPERCVPSSGLSTFKPSPASDEYVSMNKTDGNSTEVSSPLSVPTLPVVSLPPITNDRMRTD